MRHVELYEIPEEIETDRLTLCAPRPGAGAAVYESVAASLEELKPWMPWVHEPLSIEIAEAELRRAQARFVTREDLRYNIFLRDGQTYIGGTGLHRIDWTLRRFEIGYWIDSRHTGRGYATEAAKAMADLALNTLSARRVEIRVDALNAQSAAIPPKLGFKLDGRLKNALPAHDGSNEIRDMLLFSLTP